MTDGDPTVHVRVVEATIVHSELVEGSRDSRDADGYDIPAALWADVLAAWEDLRRVQATAQAREMEVVRRIVEQDPDRAWMLQAWQDYPLPREWLR